MPYTEAIAIKEEEVLCWSKESAPRSLTKMIDLWGRGVDCMFFTGLLCANCWAPTLCVLLTLTCESTLKPPLLIR